MPMVRVEFRVSKEVSEFLSRNASERGVTRSDLVEEVLRHYVDQYNIKGQDGAWMPREMQDTEFCYCLEDFASEFDFSLSDLLSELEIDEDYIKWDHATHYGNVGALQTAVAVLRMACNDNKADKLGSWIEKYTG